MVHLKVFDLFEAAFSREGETRRRERVVLLFEVDQVAGT